MCVTDPFLLMPVVIPSVSVLLAAGVFVVAPGGRVDMTRRRVLLTEVAVLGTGLASYLVALL